MEALAALTASSDETDGAGALELTNMLREAERKEADDEFADAVAEAEAEAAAEAAASAADAAAAGAGACGCDRGAQAQGCGGRHRRKLSEGD